MTEKMMSDFKTVCSLRKTKCEKEKKGNQSYSIKIISSYKLNMYPLV